MDKLIDANIKIIINELELWIAGKENIFNAKCTINQSIDRIASVLQHKRELNKLESGQ